MKKRLLATTTSNFIYYQPNSKDPFDEACDGNIRAMCKAFNLTWIEAFDELIKLARSKQVMPFNLENVEDFMRKRKFKKTIVNQKNKLCLNDFAKQIKKDEIVICLTTADYFVTCSNKKYFNTDNIGAELVIEFWKKQ